MIQKLRKSWLAWVALLVPLLYLIIPLWATFDFSLHAQRDTTSFVAYERVVATPEFASSFGFSTQTALITIFVSMALIVTTAFWVNLKLPQARSFVEFFTLIPFVVPTVVLVFGLVRAHNATGLTNSQQGVYVLLLGAYVTLSFPYMYRAVDTGLRTINIRALTEAAQSLGAGWSTILLRVILPNIIVSVLNGAFITFAIVLGEFTIASLMNQPAFGPYMAAVGSRKVYEPSALTILSLILTWICVGLFQLLGRRSVNVVGG